MTQQKTLKTAKAEQAATGAHTVTGRVVSNKMKKTIVVSVDRPYRYVRYRPAPRDRVVVRDHRGRWRR